MYVRRIQYPVGQGCFHSGYISLERTIHEIPHEFRYIYDCGSDNRKALDSATDYFRQDVNNVDALFISHLDRDHVNGLDRLLSLISVNTVFIPYVNDIVSVLDLVGADLENQFSATLVEVSMTPELWFHRRGVSHVVRVRERKDNSRNDEPFNLPGRLEDAERTSTRANLLDIDSGRPINVPNMMRPRKWVLVPHVHPVPINQLDSFKNKIKSVFGGSPSVELILEAFRDSV